MLGGAMKLGTFRTYWRQAGNVTLKAELFLLGWRRCLKAQTISKRFNCKLHLALSLPPPSLLALLYRQKPNEEVEIWGRKPSPLQCLQEDCQPLTQATALTAAKRSYFPLSVTSKGRTLKREGGKEGAALEAGQPGPSGEKEREQHHSSSEKAS